MVCRPLPAATPAAAMPAAMLMLLLAAAPVEARTCRSSDVLPAGANFSSPALVVDFEGCTELYLYSDSIGDSGAVAISEALKSNTALTAMWLDNNNIGDSGAAAIAEALKNNTALKELSLGNNNIGDSGAAAIAEALKNNTALTTLELGYNPGISNAVHQLITGYLAKNVVVKAILGGETSVTKENAYINDVGAVVIAEALNSNTALTWLYLNNNTIGDSGAAAIAETLKSNTALTWLDLNNNNIGDSGAAALAEALKSNTALTELELDNNDIGDNGAAAIAEALKSNTALTELELDNNNIGDSGAAAIAGALRSNTALTRLFLSNNAIGDSGAAAVAEMLEINTAITSLYLGSNNVTCGNHGTPQTGKANQFLLYPLHVNYYRRYICRCSGLWSGDFCHTDVPGKITLAVVFSMVAVAALAWFMGDVVNPKYIRPYRARRQEERALIRARKREERAFGIAHPINVTTVGGDAYTLEDWGHCKDLKLALKKLAPPGELGDPSTFVLLDNNGWTAPPGSGGADATATKVDTKYGSVHRANMVQSVPDAARRGNGIIELTLVYKATGDGGGVLPARTLREEASPARGVTMNLVEQSDV